MWMERRKDRVLEEVIQEARKVVREQRTVKGRVQVLALYVGNRLGGTENNIISKWEKLCRKAHKYSNSNQDQNHQEATDLNRDLNSNRLLLKMGSLIGECGLTRHGSVLFSISVISPYPIHRIGRIRLRSLKILLCQINLLLSYYLISAVDPALSLQDRGRIRH